MSDDLVRGFFFALAIMFFAPALNPLVSGRRGRMGSFLLGVALTYVTLKWPSIKDHAGPALNAFLIRTASNGFVWAAMIVATWIYFAVDSLLAPYRGARPTRTKPSLFERFVNLFLPKLPESLAIDRDYLIKELKASAFRHHKAQIFFGATEQCFRLAKEMSDILTAAQWELVNEPLPIPTEIKARKGFTIRNGTTDPASDSGLRLTVTLRAVGIDPWTVSTPDLRQFDYCFVYIAE